MAKSLERLIAEKIQTPGNIAMPDEGKDPGKGGNDPKAKGTPAPPSALLTDPKEKLKDIDKVSKRTKSAEPQAAKKNGDQSPVLQGNSKVKVGKQQEEVDVDDEDDILTEDPDNDEDDDSDMEDIEVPSEILELVDSLSEDELKVKYAELLALLAEADEENEDEEENAEQIEEESAKTLEDIRQRITAGDLDLSEDIEALFSEDDNLSEEFQRKAKTIFEGAVAAKVNEKLDELEEAFKVYVAEAIENNEKTLAEKVDDYLNYVVESWMTENEIAIERGLKSEIAEGFMTGLHQLFNDHYINVPDEKIDVMESLATQIDELKNQLNESIENSILLEKSYVKLLKEEIFLEECQGLSDTHVEKLKALSEGIEFENEELFRESLTILKENYFPKGKTKALVLEEEGTDDELSQTLSENEEQDNSSPMSYYARTLSRQVGKGK
jgi:hypothetical protein